MKQDHTTPYSILVTCAKLGNRDAALKILEVITWYVERNRTIPWPLREYFVESFNSIDFSAQNLNQAFNIVSNRKGRKVASGKLIKRHVEIIHFINDKIYNGMSKTKAREAAAEEYDIDMKTARELHRKLEKSEHGELTSFQIAYYTSLFSRAVDSFKKEKSRGRM